VDVIIHKKSFVGITPSGLPVDAPKGLSDLTLTLSYEEREVICRGEVSSPMGWVTQPLHSEYLTLHSPARRGKITGWSDILI